MFVCHSLSMNKNFSIFKN